MCDPILVTVLKMKPYYSQPSRENATPSSGTSPLASYKEVPPPPSGVSSWDKLYGVGRATVPVQKPTHAAHAPPPSIRQPAATTIADGPVNPPKGRPARTTI